MSFYLRLFFVAILLVLASLSLRAQKLYTINGIVKNDKGAAIAGATVFLGNTQKITSTSDSGLFVLGKLRPGTFQLVVKMMGYALSSGNIILQGNLPVITVKLHPFANNLNEVKIVAKDPDWDDKLQLFKSNFLGLSKYGRKCTIVNPKILKLKYDRSKRILEGHANDFLIIENPLLGYRIKYLLKTFEYHYRVAVTNYDGEVIFEELIGTADQQKEWKKNRLIAYKGSLTHFLRAVYASQHGPQAEGFLTRTTKGALPDINTDGLNQRMRPPFEVWPELVRFDTLVTVIDSALISLKFHAALVVAYDPTFLLEKKAYGGQIPVVKLGDNTSILQLVLNEAIIDGKGNYTDYRAFLMRGHWAELRVGDQLPLDYQP